MFVSPPAPLRRAYSFGDVRSVNKVDDLARRKHPIYTVQSARDGADLYYVRPLREAVQPLSAFEHHLVAQLEVPRERPVLLNVFTPQPPRYFAVALDPVQLAGIQA